MRPRHKKCLLANKVDTQNIFTDCEVHSAYSSLVSFCWNKAPLYWTRKSTETRLYKRKCGDIDGHAKRDICEQGRDDGKNDVRWTYGNVTTPRPPAIDDVYTP